MPAAETLRTECMLALENLGVFEGLEADHTAQEVLQDLSGGTELFSHDLGLELEVQVSSLVHPQSKQLLKRYVINH